MAKENNNPFQSIVDDVDAHSDFRPTTIAQAKREAKAEANSAKAMQYKEAQQKTLAQIYSAQKKFPVRIAPSYAKYFGRIMRVTINGIAIAIPCNGQVFNLPAEFACECERRMREMDAYELKSRKLADVTNNYEPDMGQLNFF